MRRVGGPRPIFPFRQERPPGLRRVQRAGVADGPATSALHCRVVGDGMRRFVAKKQPGQRRANVTWQRITASLPSWSFLLTGSAPESQVAAINMDEITMTLIRLLFSAILATALTATANAQKFKTEIAPGVAVPDEIDSSIGQLRLNYGYPRPETVEKIYDNLDRSRALQAYLMAIPIVNQAGMRDSLRSSVPRTKPT